MSAPGESEEGSDGSLRSRHELGEGGQVLVARLDAHAHRNALHNLFTKDCVLFSSASFVAFSNEEPLRA
jgi:hypothetical protein